MALLKLAGLLTALAVGAHIVRERPAHFPVYLMVMGIFRFGADVGIGVDLSAIWLLGLWALCAVAMLRLPAGYCSKLEMVIWVFIAFLFVQALRLPTYIYAVRMFLKLSYPFLVFMLARRAFACLNAPNIPKMLKKVFLSSFAGFCLVGGFAQKFWGVICCCSCNVEIH